MLAVLLSVVMNAASGVSAAGGTSGCDSENSYVILSEQILENANKHQDGPEVRAQAEIELKAALDRRRNCEARASAEAKEKAQRKKDLRVVYSAALCRLVVDREDALKDALDVFATEKQYDEPGGVDELTNELGGIVYMAELYVLRRRIRDYDEQIAEHRKAFGQTSPLACSDHVVAAVAECLKRNSVDCTEEAARYVVKALRAE